MKKSFVAILCLVLIIPAIAGAIDPAPNGTVRFYRDYQCTTGPSTTFGPGEYKDLRQYPQNDPDTFATIPGTSWNDQVSCMTIGTDISKVIVYQDINFKGKSRTYTRTSNNPLGAWSLAQDWWNDRISSMKIIK
ncbi:MAG: hypothetical protein V1793_10890 [Pseudomonadota bacterium]